MHDLMANNPGLHMAALMFLYGAVPIMTIRTLHEYWQHIKPSRSATRPELTTPIEGGPMALPAAEIGEQVHLAEEAVRAAEDRIPEGEDITVTLLKALLHRANAYGEDASAAVRQAQLLFEQERT